MTGIDCPSFTTSAYVWSVPCLLGNISLLIGITRKKLFRDPQYLFLANLAADYIAMIVCTMARVFALHADLIVFDKVLSLSFHFFARGSFIWINVLSFNRYFAITKCLRYPLIMTHSNILAVVRMAWLFSALFQVIACVEDLAQSDMICVKFQGYMGKFSLVILMIFTVFVSVSTSYAVHTSAKRQRNTIMSQIRSLHGERSEQMDSLIRQQTKTRGIFIMICISQAFFIPAICCGLMSLGDKSNLNLVVISRHFIGIYTSVSPFLYIATLKPLKSALLNFVRSLVVRCLTSWNQHLNGNNQIAPIS